MLTNSYYTNRNSMHICFSMKIKPKSDGDNNKDTDLITEIRNERDKYNLHLFGGILWFLFSNDPLTKLSR